jgi:hypothetical protein
MINLYKKLFKVQQFLKVAKSRNSQNKFKYRSLSDILEEVKPLFNELQLLLFFEEEIISIAGKELKKVEDSKNQITTTIETESRFYLKVKATMVDLESGKAIENSSITRESTSQQGMNEAQLTASVTTYARKNLLSGWFLLDESEYEIDDLPEEKPKKEEKKPLQTRNDKTSIDKKRKEVGVWIYNLSGNSKELSKEILRIMTKVDKLELLEGKNLDNTWSKLREIFLLEDNKRLEAYTKMIDGFQNTKMEEN